MSESVADLVYKAYVARGFEPMPSNLMGGALSADQKVHARRATVGKQPRGKKLSPLIVEFACVEETMDKPSGDDKTCRLLRRKRISIVQRVVYRCPALWVGLGLNCL